MSRAKAEEAWRSRVARHEDNLITQTDDLITEGIRAFTDYRRAVKEGNKSKAEKEYHRLTEIVGRIAAHPLMMGNKPGHEIRRAQYLCLTFFVSREPCNLDEAEKIVNQLIRDEDPTSQIHINAHSILALIQDLRS